MVRSVPQLPHPALDMRYSWHLLCKLEWGQGWTWSLSTWYLRAKRVEAGQTPKLRAKRV